MSGTFTLCEKYCRRLSLSVNNTAWRICHAVELAVNQWKTALIFK
ncbi:DUF3079 domain-containing protein [Salmonella enterica]